MKSFMDRDEHHRLVQRAVELGRAGDPAALPELTRLMATPSTEVRRLVASAIGKLGAFGADPKPALAVLAPAALRDPHPQVQQYALKALKAYGHAAGDLLNDLDDLAKNPAARDYVRQAASSAAAVIREAARIAEDSAVHRCMVCHRPVAADEYARAQKAFQRTYCDKCFDEVFLKRRNWETHVELNKTIRAADGTVVQSEGERIIAEELAALGLAYRYDNRFRIIKGYAIRPDFYLPEADLYIEYWGMEGNLDYEIGMLEKRKLYQQAGKRLVSLYAREKPRLSEALREKLAVHLRIPTSPARTDAVERPPDAKKGGRIGPERIRSMEDERRGPGVGCAPAQGGGAAGRVGDQCSNAVDRAIGACMRKTAANRGE